MGITYRSIKGVALTSDEVDENFRFLERSTLGVNSLTTNCIWSTADDRVVLVRMDSTDEFTFKDLGAGSGFVSSEIWLNGLGITVQVTMDETSQFVYHEIGIGFGGLSERFWETPDGRIIKVTMNVNNEFTFEDLGI